MGELAAGAFTLTDLVGRAAARGERPALTTASDYVSYGLLADRARRVAAGLRADGLRPGQRVAFLGPSGVAWAEVVLGSVLAGVVPVPLNLRLSPRELRAVVDDSCAGVVIADAALWDPLASDMAGWRGVVRLLGGPYERWRDDQEADASPHPASPADVALQLYTSGTTGRPKGVMLSHANLGCLLVRGSPAVRVDARCCNLFTLPLFHIAGAGFALITMWAGAHGVVPTATTPDALMRAIHTYGVTNTGLVPTIIQSILDHPARTEWDLSSLATVIYGAAPIAPSLLERALREIGCGFLHTYGLTETAGFVTILTPEEHTPSDPQRLHSVGRPVPWAELRVMDLDGGDPVSAGTAGEIQVRSAQVMTGYWNQPDATAEAITSDGWLRTGDMGRLDSDGYLFVVDRLKDLIITGGENVAPAEVEAVISSHPDVAHVVVLGVPDARWGEAVKAVVVASTGRKVLPQELIAFARERLAHFKCPRTVDVVEALPLTATGKVARAELRRRYVTPPSITGPC